MGSLPISRSQLRLNIEEAKLRRPPSTEIYIPSPTTRFEDTPLTLRKFLNTIRPEDSSEDDFSNCSTPRAGRSRRASSLKLPDKFKKKADLSPCSTPRSPRSPSRCLCRSSSAKNKQTEKNKMSDYSDSDDEGSRKKKGLTAEQRKKLMKTTQLTELEMVEMWNQYKFNFPTGKANPKQLKQLMKKVFPKCTETDFVVENILKVFDTQGDGIISVREILIAFAMSMNGSHREKLHWAFRLYDADNSDSIEEEELEDVFVRLCSIATNIENAQKRARNPELVKPPTPPPEPEEEIDSEEERKEKEKIKKKKAAKMQKTARMEINVKTMSSKMNQRNPTTTRMKSRKS